MDYREKLGKYVSGTERAIALPDFSGEDHVGKTMNVTANTRWHDCVFVGCDFIGVRQGPSFASCYFERCNFRFSDIQEIDPVQRVMYGTLHIVSFCSCYIEDCSFEDDPYEFQFSQSFISGAVGKHLAYVNDTTIDTKRADHDWMDLSVCISLDPKHPSVKYPIAGFVSGLVVIRSSTLPDFIPDGYDVIVQTSHSRYVLVVFMEGHHVYKNKKIDLVMRN